MNTCHTDRNRIFAQWPSILLKSTLLLLLVILSVCKGRPSALAEHTRGLGSYRVSRLDSERTALTGSMTNLSTSPDIDISKDVDREYATPGEILVYTITYSNTGSSTATGVMITDTLPTQVHNVVASPPPMVSDTLLVWYIGTLGPLASDRIAVTATVDNSLSYGLSIRNQVEINCDQTDTFSDTSKIPVIFRKFLPVLINEYVPHIPVCNGSFEAGDFTCWSHSGQLDRYVQSTVVHNGVYAAELGDDRYECNGGVPKLEAWINGSVYISEDCSVPRIIFWYRILSQDVLEYKGHTRDSFDVYVNETRILRDGNTSWPKPSCSNTWDSGWKPFTYSLRVYKGQNVDISFGNVIREDWYYNTWTYVDDVEVICQP